MFFFGLLTPTGSNKVYPGRGGYKPAGNRKGVLWWRLRKKREDDIISPQHPASLLSNSSMEGTPASTVCLMWQEMDPHFVQTLIPWLGKTRPSLKSVGERERTVPPTWVPTSGGILLDVQIWGGGWDSASLTSSQVVLRLESLEEQGTGAPRH